MRPQGTSGLIRIALASILFGLAGVLFRVAYEHGANVPAVLAVRALAVLPWLGVLTVPRHRAGARLAVGQLVPMGFLVAAGVTAFAIAVSRMSPALVALIYYAYPVFVIAGAHLLGWSRFNAFTGLAALTTLLGVALVIGLPEGDVDTLAVSLALLSGSASAAYLLFAQAAVGRASPSTCMAFTAGLSSALLLAGCVTLGVDLPSDGTGLAVLIALFATLVFPHVLLISGVGRLGGPWGSLVNCLEIVTAVVATALILGLLPGTAAIVGGALIVLGGVAAPMIASKRSPLVARRTAT